MITCYNIIKYYGIHKILDKISLTISHNETVAIIGESGSGKSTLGKILVGLEVPSSGIVTFHNRPISTFSLKHRAKIAQIVFQNPSTSLNPRMRIKAILKEAYLIHNIPCTKKTLVDLLDSVALPTSYLDKYPHELSGGEKQRIVLARAISLKPSFIVLDEVLSSLDEENQRKILDLLTDLKTNYQLTYFFITHNIEHALSFADTALVIQQGKIIDRQKVSLLASSENPYTQKLLHAAFALS